MRVAAAGVSTVGLALLAAACGGSSGGRVAQLGSTTTQTISSASAAASVRPSAVAFARCMRSHHVPNYPDPDTRGTFDKSKLTPQQLGAGPTRIEVAQRACRRLLPNGGRPPSQAEQRRIKADALAFSRCVRAHGVPHFPDPDSTGRIPDPASVGIDQGAPAFQAANRACGAYRPPYMPSNSAYDAWARTHTGG